MKKTTQNVCGLKNNPYLCNDFQLIQANVSPTTAVGIFYVKAENYNNSSVPCGALMRPLPVSGGSQRGAELFSSPVINILFHFKRLPK